MLSANYRPLCPGINELRIILCVMLSEIKSSNGNLLIANRDKVCMRVFTTENIYMVMSQVSTTPNPTPHPGPTFIKPDQLDPWIKDQIKITLLPTISHLLLPNFVSCGRACPSHMTQNLVTVGAKLWTADRFLVDPWSMDYADPVW